eukprot:6208282-Pleurochrysis_carterae.AAC.2
MRARRISRRALARARACATRCACTLMAVIACVCARGCVCDRGCKRVVHAGSYANGRTFATFTIVGERPGLRSFAVARVAQLALLLLRARMRDWPVGVRVLVCVGARECSCECSHGLRVRDSCLGTWTRSARVSARVHVHKPQIMRV